METFSLESFYQYNLLWCGFINDILNVVVINEPFKLKLCNKDF